MHQSHVSPLLQQLYFPVLFINPHFNSLISYFSLCFHPSNLLISLCLRSVPLGKNPNDGSGAGDYGVPNPGPAFKEVWQVKVWPKGLGQAKNLVGIYRLCLTDKTVNFVKLNSDAAAVVLQLMNVRRCGHSENFFFVEVGRSAVTGPGEFWMQVSL